MMSTYNARIELLRHAAMSLETDFSNKIDPFVRPGAKGSDETSYGIATVVPARMGEPDSICLAMDLR